MESTRRQSKVIVLKLPIFVEKVEKVFKPGVSLHIEDITINSVDVHIR